MTMELTLRNWSIHEKLELNFTEPVAFIVGKNGSGKTAIRDALEFLYLGTGHLRGIGTKKELGRLSIYGNAKECSVILKLPKVSLMREMKRDGSQQLSQAIRLSEKAPIGPWMQIPLDKPIVGDSALAADALRIVLEPTAFFSLTPAKRREILIGATSEAGETEENILKALTEALQPEGLDDEKALKTAAKWAADEGFREAEEQAGAIRRKAKRDLADLDFDPPDFSDIPAETLAMFEKRTLEQVQQKLQGLRDDHTAAVAREAVSTAEIEGRLKEAQDAQESAENVEYEDADEGASDGLKAAAKSVTELGEAWADSNNEVEGLRDENRQLHNEPPTAAFTKPTKCPAVSFEFKCPVRESTFEKHLPPPLTDDLRTQRLATNAELYSIAVGQRTETETRINVANEELLAAEARLDKERNRAARMDAITATIGRTRDRTQEIEGELLEAQTKVGETQDAVTAEELQIRIKMGETIVAQRANWGHANDSHADALRVKLQTEQAIARWDAITQQLKPDGIESKLGGGARAAFLAEVGKAAPLAGLVKLTEDFELMVLRYGLEWHPLQLSVSQRLALGISIQHAMAKLIQFPILICDAIDLFDGMQREEFAKFALAIGGDYAAVIGLATLTGNEPATPPEGFETYWLSRGEPVKHLLRF